MEWVVVLPIILLVLSIGLMCYMCFSSKGRNKIMQKMMKSNMDVLRDMYTGEMGETLNDLSKTTIKLKKDILENNYDELKEYAEMEAALEMGAIKKRATAVKEGFIGESKMFCKHCGTNIDSDSSFCKRCGKAQ